MKIFESDLTEAIYEIIANTGFKKEGEDFIEGVRKSEGDYTFELDKGNAVIRVYNKDEEFSITVSKTHVFNS